MNLALTSLILLAALVISAPARAQAPAPTPTLTSTPAAVPTPQKLTLKAALERAFRESPEAETAVRTEEVTRLTAKNLWSALLPSLDLSLNHQYLEQGGTNPTAQSYVLHDGWSNSLGLSLNETLYDNGDSYRAARVGSLNEQIGGFTLKRTRQQIALRVAKAYWDYSSAMLALENEREQIDALRRQFRTIEGRYRQGVSSSRDYLRIKAQVQQSEISLINGRYSLEETLANLRESIGASDQVEFEPLVLKPGQLDQINIPTVKPEDTLEFRIARLTDDTSDLKYETTARAYWPRLSLRGTASYNQPQYFGERISGLEDPYWDARGLLTLDYNIFDWGKRRRDVEIASNQRRIENAQQNATRISVSQQLHKLGIQATLLQETYRESRNILKSSEDVFASVNRDYREGKVTYLDLITALNEVYSSRSQILTIQFNLLKAQADLNALQGNLDEILLRN